MENWFVALPAAGTWSATLPPLPAGFSAFVADDLHLTVAFLGECGESAALRAWDALQGILAGGLFGGPFEVSLGPVVPLGNPARYTALGATLDRGRSAVEEVMAAHRDALCDAAGAPRERRAALAHITVARPGFKATESVRDAGLRWASVASLAEVSLRLDRVALYTRAPREAATHFRQVRSASLGA